MQTRGRPQKEEESVPEHEKVISRRGQWEMTVEGRLPSELHGMIALPCAKGCARARRAAGGVENGARAT